MNSNLFVITLSVLILIITVYYLHGTRVSWIKTSGDEMTTGGEQSSLPQFPLMRIIRFLPSHTHVSTFVELKQHRTTIIPDEASNRVRKLAALDTDIRQNHDTQLDLWEKKAVEEIGFEYMSDQDIFNKGKEQMAMKNHLFVYDTIHEMGNINNHGIDSSTTHGIDSSTTHGIDSSTTKGANSAHAGYSQWLILFPLPPDSNFELYNTEDESMLRNSNTLGNLVSPAIVLGTEPHQLNFYDSVKDHVQLRYNMFSHQNDASVGFMIYVKNVALPSNTHGTIAAYSAVCNASGEVEKALQRVDQFISTCTLHNEFCVVNVLLTVAVTNQNDVDSIRRCVQEFEGTGKNQITIKDSERNGKDIKSMPGFCTSGFSTLTTTQEYISIEFQLNRGAEKWDELEKDDENATGIPFGNSNVKGRQTVESHSVGIADGEVKIEEVEKKHNEERVTSENSKSNRTKRGAPNIDNEDDYNSDDEKSHYSIEDRKLDIIGDKEDDGYSTVDNPSCLGTSDVDGDLRDDGFSASVKYNDYPNQLLLLNDVSILQKEDMVGTI